MGESPEIRGGGEMLRKNALHASLICLSSSSVSFEKGVKYVY